MATRDSRIDDFIAQAAPFAQPILKHLRKVVHTGYPQVEETIKWGMPHFDYKGMMCGMAAFKAHCIFGFWKASLIFDPDSKKESEAMGQFGCIKTLADLPSERVLIGFVKKAAALNDAGMKAPKTTRVKAKPLATPADLTDALRRNKKAHATFEKLPPSHRKEYIVWLTEAKRVETREKRLATALEWLADGKSRNWKYERC